MPQKVAPDQGHHCLLTECSFKCRCGNFHLGKLFSCWVKFTPTPLFALKLARNLQSIIRADIRKKKVIFVLRAVNMLLGIDASESDFVACEQDKA